MANINVMTYALCCECCVAMRLPYPSRLIDLSPTTPSRQVTSICGFHHNEHSPYKVAQAESATTGETRLERAQTLLCKVLLVGVGVIQRVFTTAETVTQKKC